MADPAYSVLLPEVLPLVPECPRAVAINAIRKAAIELCKKARVWKHTPAAVDVTADTAVYALVPPAGAAVEDIDYVAVDGREITMKTEAQLDEIYPSWRTTETGDPKHYTQLSRTNILLVPKPATTITNGLTMRLILKPTPASTTLDLDTYNEWFETIAAGALARLLMMDKPWFDSNTAAVHDAAFRRGISAAKKAAEDGWSTRVHRTISYGGI